VNHGRDEYAIRKCHINGIENLWGIAMMSWSKFSDISKNSFHLHLKDTKFRFNHRNENMYKLILYMLRNNPLRLS